MDNKILIGGVAALLLGGAAVAAYQFGDRGPQFAEVVRVEPVHETEVIETPREVCEDRVVSQRQPVRDPNRVGGTVAGAVVGGLVGNQIGGGSGRKIATAAGAVGGAFAGRKVQENMQQNNVTQTVQTSCRTVTDTSTREQLVGYDVTYRWDGDLRTVRMDRDPGAALPVVDGVVVTHAEGASTVSRQ
ncbi:glycine zipper 2TM domain-containing protein [Coralloluteibacterium thermophilus]|uniref:Glycine zipper 2TM domain-containing protein n=1 Tax=Coralloluteibacterium thermophilum TaxID=2707049 RepID=A0ABV9NL91_9GAMM